MSEQRFICGMGFTNADVNFYNPIRIIHDNENDKDYYLFADLCKIMNEQQAEIDDLKGENKELKHWKKRIIEYLSDWFNKTEYLTVLYKINEINNEIGLDIDE